MQQNALKQAFARRAQQSQGSPAPQQGDMMSNPLQQMAQARGQGAANGTGQSDEAMFILKVLAKRLEQLPPHKPEAVQQPQ